MTAGHGGSGHRSGFFVTLCLFGMNTGGPAAITWGWVAVGLMTLFVGPSMAEICSAYPTSGGLSYCGLRAAARGDRRAVVLRDGVG